MRGATWTSALSLLGVNAGVILIAVIGGWSLPTILACYWLQSVIIGIFQAKKMSDLTVYSTEGFKMNGRAVDPTPATRRAVVIFFLFHYGIFHAAYAMFILVGEDIAGGPIDWTDVAISGLLFFANHLYSYLVNRGRVPAKPPNIGSMMFFPYIRIVPMHAFILFGAFVVQGGWGVVAFMVLKTIADETMHLIEHRAEGA